MAKSKHKMSDAGGNAPSKSQVNPSIALALGGGGARGLAHIAILEALDELDVEVSVIAGTSIGAIFGAAYAAGMSGSEIRSHTIETLTRRYSFVRDLLSKRAMSAKSTLSLFAGRSALLDAEAFLKAVLPDQIPETFGELSVPLHVVASDYYALEPRIITAGNLHPAIAASMALPVLFKPVSIDGRVCVDGGFVNPLPFDILQGKSHVLIAVDVSGAVRKSLVRETPTIMETLFSLSFFFERSIIQEKMKSSQPDIYVEAGMGAFNVLDFLKVKEILEAAEPAKEKFKAQLTRVLASEQVDVAQVDKNA